MHNTCTCCKVWQFFPLTFLLYRDVPLWDSKRLTVGDDYRDVPLWDSKGLTVGDNSMFI